MTKYQRLFEKEISRINRIIAQAQAERGEIEFKAPPRPKRITKQFIDRLKAVTPETIREYNTDNTTKIKKTIVKKEEKRTRKKGLDDEFRKGWRSGNPNTHNGNKKAKPPLLTKKQRSAAAKKAAQTRKEKGIKPFEKLTKEQRSAAAKKAAQTRKEKGIKPFEKLTKEQRSAAAKKAAQTRKEKGIIPFKRKSEEHPKEIFTSPDEGKNINKIDRNTGEVEMINIENDEQFSFIPTINTGALIVDNFISELRSLWGIYRRPWFVSEIMKQVTMWVSEFGYIAVATALIEAKEKGDIITTPIVYNEGDEGEVYLAKIGNFLSNNSNNADSYKLKQKLDDIENTEGFYFYDDGYPIIKE